jgi:hypothetical protein
MHSALTMSDMRHEGHLARSEYELATEVWAPYIAAAPECCDFSGFGVAGQRRGGDP